MRARVLRLARRQSPYIPIVVDDTLSWRQFAQVNVMSPGLPGVRTDILSVREYHGGHNMAHIVGYVGAADQEEVNEAPVTRLPGFRVGKTGVEKGLEPKLRGKAGVVKLEVDAHGNAIRKLETLASEPGREVVLTIDSRGPEGGHGAAQGRTPRRRRGTGRPHRRDPGDGVDPELRSQRHRLRPEATGSGIPWPMPRTTRSPTRTIRGQYPPGSTFKMVTALAGLEAGEITHEDAVPLLWRLFLFQRLFRLLEEARASRDKRVRKAIKESCDVFFYKVAERIGITKLSAMGHKLGLGQTYDCGLPLQKPGVMPTPGWKRANLGKPWYGGETIIAGIGQGFVLTTPLQLAVMTARIATGRAIVPRIVRPYPDEQVEEAEPLDIKPEHLEIVREGMWAVVNEGGGTAGRARLPIAGVEMAGKTGTSQVHSASSGRKSSSLKWHQRDHGLFVGYAPADNPRYAVAAIVEHGGSGSRAASPVVRDIMTALMERDPVGKPGYVARDAERKTAGGTASGGEG